MLTSRNNILVLFYIEDQRELYFSKTQRAIVIFRHKDCTDQIVLRIIVDVYQMKSKKAF